MGKRALGNVVATGLLAALTVTACSSWDSLAGFGSSHKNGGASSESYLAGEDGGVGSVGIHLTLASGTTLTSVKWTIANATNSYSGVADIGDAQSLEFVQGGIVAGDGYTVQLDGADNRGDLCTGTSPPFTITAGAVSQTVLTLTCSVAADGSIPSNVNTGSVEIDASVNLITGNPAPCPGITSFSISPAGINLSQTALLSLVTIGPPSEITWSVSPATGGMIASPHAATTTFACASGGAFVPQVTVTATVVLLSSGLCDGQTFTSTSALVNCQGG